MTGIPGMPLPWWAPELKPCGTLAAARRHLRHGEPMCQSCRQAQQRYDADRASARRAEDRRRRLVRSAGEG